MHEKSINNIYSIRFILYILWYHTERDRKSFAKEEKKDFQWYRINFFYQKLEPKSMALVNYKVVQSCIAIDYAIDYKLHILTIQIH